MLVHGRTTDGRIIPFNENGPFSGTPTGPVQNTLPTFAPGAPVKIGTAYTITPGTYSALGGGTVSVLTEWRVNGVSKPNPYTPVTADDLASMVAFEEATETAGTAPGVKTTTVNAGTISHVTPAATGALADQTFTDDTGLQQYDASADFTGLSLTYSLNNILGVSINGNTGVLSFDTDAMALQAGTPVIVTAGNSGGSVDSAFQVSIVVTEAAAAISNLVANPDGNITFDTTGNTGTAYVTFDTKAAPTAQDIIDGTGDVADNFPITLSGGTSGNIDLTSIAGLTRFCSVVHVTSGGNSNILTVSVDVDTVAATVPAAFAVEDWTVSDPATGGALDVTINTLPADGGSALTDIKYALDGGGLVTVGATASFQIVGLTNDQAYSLEIYAVNAVGDSLVSDSKVATPTLAVAATFVVDSFHVIDSAVTSVVAFDTSVALVIPAGKSLVLAVSANMTTSGGRFSDMTNQPLIRPFGAGTGGVVMTALKLNAGTARQNTGIWMYDTVPENQKDGSSQVEVHIDNTGVSGGNFRGRRVYAWIVDNLAAVPTVGDNHVTGAGGGPIEITVTPTADAHIIGVVASKEYAGLTSSVFSGAGAEDSNSIYDVGDTNFALAAAWRDPAALSGVASTSGYDSNIYAEYKLTAVAFDRS